MRQLQAIVLAAALILAASCGSGSGPDAGDRPEAAALADQEDPVCGMFVREQPAPRGQLVHRDGSRFFLCSLGDLWVHLDAPSPHGREQAVYVEVLKPTQDPAEPQFGEHPWVIAEDAWYVVGVARQGIMGEPVLAYAERSEAETAKENYDGDEVLDYAGVRRWWKDLQAAR